MAKQFTQSELEAYLDEALSPNDMAAVEAELRSNDELGKLLATSGWKEGARANCLFLGPDAVEAAIAAGRLPGLHAYTIAGRRSELKRSQARADATGLYGASVFAREGSLSDTSFPDLFFHRVVASGGVKPGDEKELWRVTRPGGKLLLSEARAARG